MLSLNDSVLFMISLMFLAFYYILFNSDVFIDSTIAAYPPLVKALPNGKYIPEFAGEIVIMILIITFYSATYLLLVNLI